MTAAPFIGATLWEPLSVNYFPFQKQLSLFPAIKASWIRSLLTVAHNFIPPTPATFLTRSCILRCCRITTSILFSCEERNNSFLGNCPGLHWIAMFISIIIYHVPGTQVTTSENLVITMITKILKLHLQAIKMI